MVAFLSDLSAHNRQISVFGLSSNVYENLQSNLLTLGYFTGTYSPDGIGLFSLDPSGADTMEA